MPNRANLALAKCACLRITEAHDYDLVGHLTNAPESSFAPAAQGANPFPILAAQPARTHGIPVR